MIYVLIVLYNKKLNDSNSYNSIKKYLKKIQLIVFDNSTKDYQNKEYCREKNIVYFTSNKNIGLSKAYNYVIDNYIFNNNDYIMILDDDTVLSNEYMSEVFKIVKENNHIVNLPIIIANNKIISPVKVEFNCRIGMFKKINTIKSNNISAINSGMLLKTCIFNKIRYNDKLFLDYVDHDFMKKVRKENISVNIMKSIIKQNYSRFQLNDLDSELIRFKIYLKDFKIYCKESHNLLFYYISTIKYRFQLFLKYKKIIFLITK